MHKLIVSLLLCLAVSAGAEEPYLPVVVGNRMFFVSATAAAGSELWVTDGTAGETRMLVDLTPGASTFALLQYLRALGDKVVFLSGNGHFAVSDGTVAGTRVIRTGRAQNGIIVVNGIALFNFDDLQNGDELWRSDGTDAGTHMVADLSDRATGVQIAGLTAGIGLAGRSPSAE